jgi:hypothetical protein
MVPECGATICTNSTNSNCCFANEDQDAFILEAPWVDNGIGGGTWVLHSKVVDAYSGIGNSGGSVSYYQPILSRYRDLTAYHNSRTYQGWQSGLHGLQSSGDGGWSGNALPEPSQFVFYSTLYNAARNDAIDGPHGSGSTHVANTDILVPNNDGWAYHRCGIVQTMYNNIFASPSTSGQLIGDFYSCGDPSQDTNQFAPNVFNNLFYRPTSSLTLGGITTQCMTSTGTFTGVGCKDNTTCQTGETCRALAGGNTMASPPPFISLETTNKVGYGATNDPLFIGTGGSCYSGAFDGRVYSDCNFNLQAGSPAIDAGTYFMLTSGAGFGSTVAVKANTPEPYQVGSLGVNWAPAKRPFYDDPRTYFIALGANWGIDASQSDVIRIKGATCTNAAADLGSVERAKVVSMTATSITLDRTCTWSDGAGVHLPWAGTAPDMGAYEFGLSSGLLGDLDGNGTIDALDLQHLVNVLLGLEANPKADLDGDGTATILDLQRLVNLLLGL